MRGLENPFVRWWVSFSVIAVAMITTLLAGMGSFIAAGDKTFLSWLVLAIFFGGSLHLGHKVRVKGHNSDQSTTVYFIETCTTLGLLGTIIGLIMMIVGAFTNIDVANQASIKAALVAISSGIGTALITTLVGLVCAILLRLQLVIVHGKWRA